MSNRITAYFKGRIGVAESVYQNDSGLIMVFDSIDLPAHFDCYFSRLNQEESFPGVGADNMVAIPNDILANPGNITVHIPLHTSANDSEVEYIVYFKIIGRARPMDDGTPTQMTAIEQALALLQNPITNIEQIVNEALAFTGETFEEMQEDLDEWKTDTEEGLETWKGGVESDFDILQAQFDTAVGAVTTDTEVTDIRVGADGVTDTTAGASVRRQFTDLKSDLNDMQNVITDGSGYVTIHSAWEMGSLSKYGVTGESVNIARIKTPFYQNGAKKIKIETTDNSIVLVVTQTVAAYGQSNNTVPNYDWRETPFEIDVDGDKYIGICTGATSVAEAEAKCTISAYYETYKKEDVEQLSLGIGKNLFNPNADGVITGKYLDTSGNPTALAGWNISDYIDVSEYENIVASIWNPDEEYVTYGKLSLLHTYNANKVHIAKVWEQSTNGVYTVGTNVAYVRFCWQPNNELANGRKLMVENGSERSAKYEPYKLVTRLNYSAYPTFEETETMIQSGGAINYNAVCWGDSLTYSQYSENITYPQRLANLAGISVKNFGMPGASSMDISGLQGGMPIYLAPFTLPATANTSVQVTFVDCNGNSDMYFGFMHYDLLSALSGKWTVDGIQVGVSYLGNNQMAVYRTSAGDDEIVFDRPVRLVPQYEYNDYINIFWVGTNDAPTTAEKAQRTIDIIKNMVDYFGGKRYLVLGLTVKSYADATNDLMGQTFGNHYVDVKDYLIKYGLDDNSLTPTAQDTTDISNSVVPTSLRHDSVHFNDYGYTAIGNCVYQHGKDLGYWN